MKNNSLLYGIGLLTMGIALTLPLMSAQAGEPVSAAPKAAARPQSTAIDIAPATAKTVQVTMTQWGIRPAPVGQPFGPIEVVRKSTVLIDRTNNKAKLEEIPLPSAPDGYRPSVSVFDGKTQYDLIGTRNQYQKSTPEVMADGLRGAFGVNGLGLAVGWKSGMGDKFTPAPDETLDGKTFKIYTRSSVVNSRDGETTLLQKFYVDPTTKLPTRFSLSTTSKGETREVVRTEFADWKLNEPIEATRLAWVPPAGVTEYKAPERPPLLAAGTAAPDFTVQKWGGGELKLSDYKGKVVVLDFWATWCGPCQMTMPHVEKVHKQAKDKGVVTLGVCVWDKQEDYAKWVPANSEKYTFQFAFDPAGRAAGNIAQGLYKVSGIPTTYVIDRDGKVIDAIVGYREDDDRLEKALAKAGVKL
jgi:thiol-disulfide isomerase/thioredoxin